MIKIGIRNNDGFSPDSHPQPWIVLPKGAEGPFFFPLPAMITVIFSSLYSGLLKTGNVGSIWRETVYVYKNSGTAKIRVIGFTVAKGDKWINITIGAIPQCFKEEFKKIPYILEFE